MASEKRPETDLAVLVDSNVLLDILTDDPRWADWSAEQIEDLADRTSLVINPLIYAEISVGFERAEEVEEALPSEFFRREALPWDAAFLAGKSFLTYRQRRGNKRSPLPDFYIGAHAAVRGYRLLTRDPKRYRTYFPGLEILAPEE